MAATDSNSSRLAPAWNRPCFPERNPENRAPQERQHAKRLACLMSATAGGNCIQLHTRILAGRVSQIALKIHRKNRLARVSPGRSRTKSGPFAQSLPDEGLECVAARGGGEAALLALGRYLARRGFSYDVAKPVVERVWSEMQV